jgi:hypothetical protein
MRKSLIVLTVFAMAGLTIDAGSAVAAKQSSRSKDPLPVVAQELRIRATSSAAMSTRVATSSATVRRWRCVGIALCSAYHTQNGEEVQKGRQNLGALRIEPLRSTPAPMRQRHCSAV